MEKMILSLKNLYKVLLTKDFPIYSECVIGEKDRKGQTVLRFWQRQMIEEFRCLPYGKMIWRSDGKRNRYTSHLCNRSTELKCYTEYAREIASQISVTSLLNQTARFMEFLSGNEYRHDILLRRIQEMVRLLDTEDPRACKEITDQLRDDLTDCAWLGRYGVQGNLFHAGYLLTVMTLYAAAGEAMDDPALAVLREDAYSMRALWKAKNHRKERRNSSTTFLTVHVGMLQDHSLPRHRFFGREEELYDLQEMVRSHQKCLISGIGGIGKSELLRQLLRLCTGENLVDQIAVVPYQTGIVESFARAFPDFQRREPEESFRQILHKLKQAAGNGRLLLLIDNLDKGPDEDPELTQLQSLPCGVLITSRRSNLEGFETYRLMAPSTATGALIFRDNYGSPLNRQDRELLKGLIGEEAVCHPLTLRLMARAARSKNWSVAQLKENLQQKNIALTWTEEEGTVRLNQLYSRLYSLAKVPDACQETVELFTMLPGGSYSCEFLEDVFSEIVTKDGALEAQLESLLEGGWLEADNTGFSMHPLIAQCLRRRVITEARLETVLQCLHRQLPNVAAPDETAQLDEKYRRVSEILICVSEYITGSISRQLMLDIISAMGLLTVPRKTIESYGKYLEHLYKRCPERDDFTDIALCTVLAGWKLASSDQILSIYHRQKEQLTVPKLWFWSFCLCAGASLIMLQQPEEAERLLKEVLHEDAAPEQKGKAYYHLAGLSHCMGKSEDAMSWAQQGVEYTKNHPQCDDDTRFYTTAMLCTLCLKFNRQEESRKLVQEMAALTDENSLPVKRQQYLSCKSTYELAFGDPEKALTVMREEQALALEYTGKDRNYYSILGRIAQTLQRLKRYGEAEAGYHEVLEHARRVGDTAMLQMASNNISVLYLSVKEAEKALFHLETAVAEGRKLGGLMLGESLKNRALAYGQLGDSEKEYACLKEAAPLLEAAYGPEHPRAAAASRRLEELTALYEKEETE